jgi:CRISPR-associated protein Csx14
MPPTHPDHLPSLRPVTLVATLGGQPQVVTLALDALLARGLAVSEVYVLYLSGNEERLTRARARLTAEFAPEGQPGYRSIALHVEPIRAHGRVPLDIYDETDADAAWRAVYDLLARLKSDNRTLHICISGGRRILGLLTLSAAMLQFGHQDALWHMYTPPALQAQSRDGALMHLPPNSGFRLIRVPMMPWGSYFPALQELARPAAGEDVLAPPRRVLDNVERARADAVRGRLTMAQRRVLDRLAAGETPQQAAAALRRDLSTIDSHKTAILAECRVAWGLPEETRLDYRFIWDKFGREDSPAPKNDVV